MSALTRLAGAAALACCTAAGASEAPPPSDAATVAAIADLGLAMLRQPGPANAVVSPVATAAALGMVHAGLLGPAEQEIEALFGPRGTGPNSFKQRLPVLLKQVGEGNGSGPSPYVMAGRVWMDKGVAPFVPAGYTQRMAMRYKADAARVVFAHSDETRGLINGWTAEHTAGRITELLPPGSISPATKLTLTSAIHFRSAWAKPFDAAVTEPRPFQAASGAKPVPTLLDERSVLQAQVDGTQVLSLPFAGPAYALLLAVPAEGSNVDTLMKGLSGATLARWQGALQAQKCKLALPKFSIAAKAGSLRPVLEGLGVKTVFTTDADLKPMLGRQAKDVHLDDVYQAAGITIDERGGEAVAAAAATLQSKGLALMPEAVPDCAVQRPFMFAVVHRPSGTALFMGRVGDPTLVD